MRRAFGALALVMVTGCRAGAASDSAGATPSASVRSPEKSAKPVQREPPDLLTQVGEWRDKMCACADKACTDQLSSEFRAWRKSLPRATGPGSDDPLEKLGDPWEKAEAELKVCRKKHD